MNGGRLAAIICVPILLFGIAFLAPGCGREAPERAAPPPALPADQPAPLFTGGANQMEVTLFFVSADGENLAPEKRSIFRTATVNDRARQTLQALLEGPTSGLLPSAPPGTRLLEIFLARDGIAYVDLSAEFRRGLEPGSSDAVYAVFSIVNTLAENFGEIQKVKILIEGDEVEDVGGHLDLSRPILPEMGLVSAAPPGSPAVQEPAPVEEAIPPLPPEPPPSPPPEQPPSTP